MTAYETIILINREEIEDRAIQGYSIPKERLLSMDAPKMEGLYDAYRNDLFCPDSRSLTERIPDHQKYDYALVVTEYIEGESVRYAIYKGNRQECFKERNRFEESERSPVGYRQNGNGKPRLRYKDLLGQNREYAEARMRDVNARSKGKSQSEASYEIRENLLIIFHFDYQNKIRRIIFSYRERISSEQVIEEIGYDSGECERTGEMTYTIQTSAGVRYLRIDSDPQRGRTIAQLFEEHNGAIQES